MNKENTIDKLWEKLKELGEEQKELIEISDMVSDVITQMVKARNDAGLTQRQLAELTNIKQTQIARIESLQTNPTLNTLARYAYLVNASISCLPKHTNQYVYVKADTPIQYNNTSMLNIKISTEHKDDFFSIQEDIFSYNYDCEYE